jgi:hypothetical protein
MAMRLLTGLLLILALMMPPLALAQTSPPPSPNAAYFYAPVGGEQAGPVSLAELQALIAAGTVAPDTWIWTNGMAGWERADKVAGVAELFTAPGPDTIPTPVNITAQTISIPRLAAATTEADRNRVAIVLGATLGILFHEFGHALVGEIGIPATGPEEDAADEFSALLLGTALAPANLGGEDPGVQRLITSIVQYSTLLWHYDARAGEAAGLVKPWYDEHSDSSNRFRNTFCLIYGADPGTQTELADWVQFPQRSRERCAYEYPRRFKAWETITAPYVRDPGDGTGHPQNQPKGTPGGKLTVTYAASSTATGQFLLPVFEESGMFDALAAVMQESFVWPRDFRLEFADCGEANAFYDPQNIRIVMCWEGVEYFAGTVLDGVGVPRR